MSQLSREPDAACVRVAVRLSRWRLEAEPKFSMEFNFLLNLVESDKEREAVFKFVRGIDQKRALLSRLLAQHVCSTVLGATPLIQRTAGRKPFVANRPPASPFRNFNFNVSHEGDLVVAAAEPACLCGVDVCSASQLKLAGKDVVEELRNSFEPQFSRREWRRLESARPDEAMHLFKTLWSCKEAFVKARGDGLQFELSRIEFEPARVDERGRWTQAVVRIDGNSAPDRDWRFDIETLDDEHVCTVALGPVSSIIDKVGNFKDTMTGPRKDREDLLRRQRPTFTFIAVSDLVPHNRREEFEDIRQRYNIPSDDDNDDDDRRIDRLTSPFPRSAYEDTSSKENLMTTTTTTASSKNGQKSGSSSISDSFQQDHLAPPPRSHQESRGAECTLH